MARIYRIEGIPNTFAVPSTTRQGVGYLVRLTPFPACTCPGFRAHGHCKHIEMVRREVFGAEEKEKIGQGARDG